MALYKANDPNWLLDLEAIKFFSDWESRSVAVPCLYFGVMMINQALKTIRQFHGLTQAEVAARLGISKSYVSEIESGKKSISYELLQNYADIFDLPVSSLVFFSESLEVGHPIPERFRRVVAEKIIKIMEWVIIKDEAKAT